MRSTLCFLMTWFCMWQIKLNFKQFNMIITIWKFSRIFIAVLLLSEYYKVPYRNLYWEDAPGAHNEAISYALSGNELQEKLWNFHLACNAQITNYRYRKERVLFEKMNFNFKQYGPFINYSVDESFIPYYGKHGKKQFIRGKHVRFGFTLWCISSSEGYLPQAELYHGVDTDLPDTGLGHGADVVLRLIQKWEVKAVWNVTSDNLFISILLLDEMTEHGICAFGTPACTRNMLPVILSARLNSGQSQLRNELMCRCRNLSRTATSKWVVLIC